MKTTMHEFDGILYKPFETKTFVLIVARGMIESIIQKTGIKYWLISKPFDHHLANKDRVCVKMWLITSVRHYDEICSEKLGFQTNKSECYFYSHAFDRTRPMYKRHSEPRYWLFNAKTKEIKLTETAPFRVQGFGLKRGTGSNSHLTVRRLYRNKPENKVKNEAL